MTLIAKTPEELIDRLKSLKNVAMCKVCLPDTWIPKEKAFKLFREKKMSIPSLFTAKLKANSLSGDRSGSPSMTTGSVEQFRSASASTPVSRKDVSPEDKNKFVKIVQQLLRNRGTHLTDSEIRTLSFDLLNNVLLGRHQFLDIENIISLEQKDDYLTYMMGIYGIKI
ncbi:uncharacterized protein LOC130735232 [Lotus japonicus]|uniref:uncharacterized protein LOC130735232 n=1 Tax=Lotus japonicus TaxID=34305 RepID=UPI0025912246|nr:uncharacterized protein LOC130735232 [Lotus japonicus]